MAPGPAGPAPLSNSTRTNGVWAAKSVRAAATDLSPVNRMAGSGASEDTPEASELRATMSKSVAGEPPKPGGILAALRRSPLVGADLDLSRPREKGRKVDL